MDWMKALGNDQSSFSALMVYTMDTDPILRKTEKPMSFMAYVPEAV